MKKFIWAIDNLLGWLTLAAAFYLGWQFAKVFGF